MDLPKVILYYGFTPLKDPEAVKVWQKNLCQSLNLTGRIIVSPHGINGTLGGNMEDLKKYIKQTKLYSGFNKINFKWSEGTGNDFPKLSVKVLKARRTQNTYALQNTQFAYLPRLPGESRIPELD
jgi:UPF0176 protein